MTGKHTFDLFDFQSVSLDEPKKPASPSSTSTQGEAAPLPPSPKGLSAQPLPFLLPPLANELTPGQDTSPDEVFSSHTLSEGEDIQALLPPSARASSDPGLEMSDRLPPPKSPAASMPGLRFRTATLGEDTEVARALDLLPLHTLSGASLPSLEDDGDSTALEGFQQTIAQDGDAIAFDASRKATLSLHSSAIVRDLILDDLLAPALASRAASADRPSLPPPQPSSPATSRPFLPPPPKQREAQEDDHGGEEGDSTMVEPSQTSPLSKPKNPNLPLPPPQGVQGGRDARLPLSSQERISTALRPEAQKIDAFRSVLGRSALAPLRGIGFYWLLLLVGVHTAIFALAQVTLSSRYETAFLLALYLGGLPCLLALYARFFHSCLQASTYDSEHTPSLWLDLSAWKEEIVFPGFFLFLWFLFLLSPALLFLPPSLFKPGTLLWFHPSFFLLLLLPIPFWTLGLVLSFQRSSYVALWDLPLQIRILLSRPSTFLALYLIAGAFLIGFACLLGFLAWLSRSQASALLFPSLTSLLLAYGHGLLGTIFGHYLRENPALFAESSDL